MSWKCYLHGTGRFFASVDPLMLFNTLWFCLYCIYCNFFFLKKAFLRQTTDVWGSACERGRTCFIYRLPATSAFAELFVVHLCYWSTQLNTLWLAREKKKLTACFIFSFIYYTCAHYAWAQPRCWGKPFQLQLPRISILSITTNAYYHRQRFVLLNSSWQALSENLFFHPSFFTSSFIFQSVFEWETVLDLEMRDKNNTLYTFCIHFLIGVNPLS